MTEQVKAKIENSLTVLLVSDLEKSNQYYRDVLGCEVNDVWAIRDDFGLGFKLIQAKDPQDVIPNKGTWNTYAYVENFSGLDALYEELKAKGATIALEPIVEDHDWGSWKEFAIKDIDGYIIGFGSGNRN
ncbi:VOC family protein [Paenibacillus chitinolyticus]|uniref:VOC family protein n=1 Tax=Paenibacillus chitinolyticus TaxID=79263 RepID=UPI002DB82F6F|nr:VOC family protein [Paenibacillus chitinolyticus]MEC0248497.1 VOC family protein [Paenibacillus chitinolyticus]